MNLLTNFIILSTACFLILSNFELMGMFGIFSRYKKNRDFSYTPRHYNDEGKGNPYKLEHKFDKFRNTVDTPRGLKSKYRNAMEDIRTSGDRNLKLRMVIIICVLVLIFLYVIDFDLSIFYK